ncbi:sensor histidine kinase [Jidongwangia harbinensis]|uniref:sensor histidine kinase n=1 Tax=Jidongwangia harbinensis TaxID=2878561 RepID=UPI001CDA4DDE|nr:histidine kinase [Jidongwangia harbinensis]MCA2217701.1 histidine kinase [Jidongwangia harbinensis]
MRWLTRVFDARDTLVRMVLLDLSGISYLMIGTHADFRPTAQQWLLAVPAFASALVFHRRPAVNLLIQAALLTVAFVILEDETINQVGASWALLELTIAAGRRTVWWGSGLLGVLYLAFSLGDPWRQFLQSVFGLGVVVGLPVLLGLVIRTSRDLTRQAAERVAEEQRRRESEARAARAAERSTIARELHDVVAHHVASMVLRVGVARHVLPDLDPRVGEVFDDLHRTGTLALADLRRLVAVLRDPQGVRGDAALTAIDPSALAAALSGAVETARGTGLIVDADIDDAVGSVDAVRALAVLRLTQEALTNVAKHAGTAARTRLRVAVTDGDLLWEVSDDGGGPDAPPPPPGGGHGLTGMRERVEVLGGSLEAGRHGEGWRVRTVLPAEAATTGPRASSPAGDPAVSGTPEPA